MSNRPILRLSFARQTPICPRWNSRIKDIFFILILLAFISLTVTSTNAASYNLANSASTVPAGGSVKVTWVAPAGSSGLDWVGLFKVGDPNRSFILNKLRYTNGSISGSFTTTAPTTPGNYEFRYLLNDGYTDVARSGAIAVGTVSSQTPPPVGSYSLSPSASSVQAGASLTVSWTAPSGSSAQDWVSLIKVGDANQGYIPNKWIVYRWQDIRLIYHDGADNGGQLRIQIFAQQRLHRCKTVQRHCSRHGQFANAAAGWLV